MFLFWAYISLKPSFQPQVVQRMDLSVSSLLYASAEDKSTYGPGRSLISFKSISKHCNLNQGSQYVHKKGVSICAYFYLGFEFGIKIVNSQNLLQIWLCFDKFLRIAILINISMLMKCKNFGHLLDRKCKFSLYLINTNVMLESNISHVLS